MLPLDTRQRKLLLLLLKSSQPQPANHLAEQVGITARMARYHLILAQNWLAEREVELILKQRSGILLKMTDAVRQKLMLELEQNPSGLLSLQAEDRLLLLLFELLSSGEYLTSLTLEARLAISHTTLGRDLEAAETWLANHHLYIHRKPRQGLMVVGREDDYRHTLTSLILDVCPEMALIDVFSWGKPVQDIHAIQPGTIQAQMISQISEWGPSAAWRYMSQIEDGLGVSLVDRDHLSLSLYFCVMVRRIRLGQTVDLPVEKINDLLSLPKFQTLHSVSDRYYRETGLHLPDAELVQLTLETATSLRQLQVDESFSEPVILKQKEVSPKLVQQLVDSISAETGCDLAHPEVIERMIQHLRRSITRLQYGLPISNPLMEQVHQEFPDLWKATEHAAETLQTELNVVLPPEEIAFLTMYMGLSFEFSRLQVSKPRPRVIVACPSGGVAVWMLVSRLRSEIPEIEIVDVVSIRQLNSLKLQSVDAVISTASFSSRQKPIITVSPFVDSQEVTMIRRRLNITP